MSIDIQGKAGCCVSGKILYGLDIGLSGNRNSGSSMVQMMRTYVRSANRFCNLPEVFVKHVDHAMIPGFIGKCKIIGVAP